MTYPEATPPKWLFTHIFGDSSGILVTFSGRQARLDDRDARANELTAIRHRFFTYPDEVDAASMHLLGDAKRGRDAYFGVHLYRKPGNRRAANSVPTVRALWLDEDGGAYPETGPEPTAIVSSSADRRHLYWRLTHQVSVEWAVKMNKRIAAWAGGDSGKAALASVLRPPGTCNFKRHPQVDPVTVQFTGVGQWEPDVLEQAIPPVPETPRRPGPRGYDGPEITLRPYLENPALEVLREVRDSLGEKYAIICPWVDEHSGGDRSGTRIGRREGGGLWFHCDHEHCQGRGWREFREVIRPVYLAVIRPPRSNNTLRTVRLNRG